MKNNWEFGKGTYGQDNMREENMDHYGIVLYSEGMTDSSQFFIVYLFKQNQMVYS